MLFGAYRNHQFDLKFILPLPLMVSIRPPLHQHVRADASVAAGYSTIGISYSTQLTMQKPQALRLQVQARSRPTFPDRPC
jgi:hypothetical protein